MASFVLPLHSPFTIHPRHAPNLSLNCLGNQGCLGERIGLWDDNEANSWFRVVDYNEGKGLFRLSPEHARHLYMNIAGWEKKGGKVVLWDDKEDNSLFKITAQEGDWLQISPVHALNCSLNVAGGEKEKGGGVILWNDKEDNSWFQVKKVVFSNNFEKLPVKGEYSFRIIPRHAQDLSLNCFGGEGEVGEKIGLWDDMEKNSEFQICCFDEKKKRFRLSPNHAPRLYISTREGKGGEVELGKGEGKSETWLEIRERDGEWILLSFVKNNSVWFNIAGEEKKGGKLVLWDDRNDNSWFRFQRIYGGPRGCGEERGGDFPEGYEKVKELGKGGQGAAYLCKKILWTGVVRNVCLKKAPVHTTIYELKFLAQYYHPNLVQLNNAFEYKKNGWLEMEYIENAQPLSIPTKSQFCGVKFEGKDVLGVFKQVMRGLKVLHESGVSHRDLHGENVLIFELDKEYKAKIIDLGWCAKGKKWEGKKVPCQYSCYKSPERRTGSFGEKDDVWAAGCLFLEIILQMKLNKSKGLEWEERKKLLGEVEKKGGEERGRKFSDVLLNCLRIEEKNRFASKEMVNYLEGRLSEVKLQGFSTMERGGGGGEGNGVGRGEREGDRGCELSPQESSRVIEFLLKETAELTLLDYL